MTGPSASSRLPRIPRSGIIPGNLPGKSPVPLRWVLIRDPLGELRSQALLCTDPAVASTQIIAWFVLRWQLEVTFQEVRAHLGVETQRQWSDLAIARTTPVLLGLFSWVTLGAHLLGARETIPVRTAAWYEKHWPTFSDAMALVRQHLWPASEHFCMSRQPPDIVKIPRTLLADSVPPCVGGIDAFVGGDRRSSRSRFPQLLVQRQQLGKAWYGQTSRASR